MTLKSSLICSTVRESSFPERGRRSDMWHWEMLLTPSCLARQDTFRQLPFPPWRDRQGTHGMAALLGGFLEEVAGPTHRARELAVPTPIRGHSVEVLQRVWHLLG